MLVVGSAGAATPAAGGPPRAGDEHWVIAAGDHWLPVVDELGQDLERARKEFLAGHRDQAVGEIRKAAAFLRDEQTRADQKAQLDFGSSIAELEALAGDIENGRITEVSRLDASLIRVVRDDVAQRWVVISQADREWLPLSERPERHFEAARWAFVSRDEKDAADGMRKAAAYIDLAAARATGERRHALRASTTELDTLARRVQEGKVGTVTTLDAAFARADYALASWHYRQASECWSKKRAPSAGRALEAAATDLRHGLAWAGHPDQAGAGRVIARTRALGTQLRSGAPSGGVPVVAEMHSFGDELARLRGMFPAATS